MLAERMNGRTLSFWLIEMIVASGCVLSISRAEVLRYSIRLLFDQHLETCTS